MKNILAILLLLTVFASCNREKLPEGILGKNKMADILLDIHLSEGIIMHRFSLGITRDSFPDDIYLSICKKHQVDHRTLEKSLYYYGRNPEKFTKIYDVVLDRLSELEVEARKEENPVNSPNISGGDTITNRAYSFPEDSAGTKVRVDTIPIAKKEKVQMEIE